MRLHPTGSAVPRDVLLPGTLPTDMERLYVVVAAEDVEQARTVLQAWNV